MSAGIVFHSGAAIAYAILAIALWRPVLAEGGEVSTGPKGRLLLLVAIVLHGLALREAILGGGDSLHLGLMTAISAALWLGLIVFWLESLFIRIDGLLLILLPVIIVICVLAALFPGSHSVAHANSEWLRMHLLIALMAYGLITVAALHAVLMAALDRQLHRPGYKMAEPGLVNRTLESMPPLLVQEHLLFRLIWIGFIVLTLAVASGSIVSLRLLGTAFPFDHKTVFTLLSWLTFGVLLVGRYARGWRGRVALRWTLTGFAFLLLAYTGSRFVLEIILQRG